jgi:hypothetical protein
MDDSESSPRPTSIATSNVLALTSMPQRTIPFTTPSFV